MVGSIDPRCETVRGTHWPEDRSCGCLELASRKPSWPAVQSDRTNRPDIWMQAIRSDLKNLLCHGGRPHMGPGLRRDDELLRGGPLDDESRFIPPANNHQFVK